MTKAIAILTLSFLLLIGCKTKKEASESPSIVAEEVFKDTGTKPHQPMHKFNEAYSPTTLIIMVDSLVGKEPLRQAIKEYGATLIYDYTIIPGVAIRIPEGTTLEQGIAYFRKVRGVVSVNKDRITRLTDPVRAKS